MKWKIENDQLCVRVKSLGGELSSVYHKPTGTELLWQADPAVWPGQAPILFPHCGGLVNDTLTAKGQSAPARRHGFARESEFAFVEQEAGSIRLRLEDSAETRALYPYAFRLDMVYSLDGATLTHRVEVYNPSGEGALPFNVGFHPAFALPMGEARDAGGYEFRFDVPESPMEIKTPNGLVSGEIQQPFKNKSSIPLTDDLFAADSICFTGLQSEHITLAAKSGRGPSVRVGIAGFPYVLLWGPARGPQPFVCIEPWHGVPDPVKPYGDFEAKPGVTRVAPGECFTTDLVMEFTC